MSYLANNVMCLGILNTITLLKQRFDTLNEFLKARKFLFGLCWCGSGVNMFQFRGPHKVFSRMLKIVLCRSYSGSRKLTSYSECFSSFFPKREVLTLSSKLMGAQENKDFVPFVEEPLVSCRVLFVFFCIDACVPAHQDRTVV